MSGTLIKRTGPLWPNYRGNFSTHAIMQVVWAIKDSLRHLTFRGIPRIWRLRRLVDIRVRRKNCWLNFSVASFPGRLPLRFLDHMRDFESCMRSITRSGRRPGNEAIGTCVIYSESEEAPASSASMLGTPMTFNTFTVIYCTSSD